MSRFSAHAVRAFETVFRPWMRTRIHRVHLAGLPRELPSRRPILIAANHVSWWDGFIVRELQRRIRPGAPMYSLMSVRELRRFPFFRLLGVIGIERGSPASLREALRELEATVAAEDGATVLIFPQGRIYPSHRRPLGFEPGVTLFARHLGAVVLPVAIHIEPLNHPAPSAFVYAGDPLPTIDDPAVLESGIADRIDRVLDFLAEHGEAAPLAWPGVNDQLAPRASARVPA